MEKVIFKEEILLYFDELISILFDQEYFSYEKNAILYVDKIVDFIILEINSFPHKSTPQKLRHLGSNYIFYKANNRTTWYIFFERQDSIFLITGISNNHCEEAKKR
ncbi:hypothetical protein DNC80_03960 [Flavobacterium sp. SOK18b]|uniref:hypothetical protein n=1 Tax=Flavobacterium sp. SOK18b TaxID=797900 RepID=UPI0015FA9150|nr:hypothetical protein [Flavobacterium sp. SOK18b]MBB1192820.1 hypothetical protein [Flavobacterium sp. SOK18b]